LWYILIACTHLAAPVASDPGGAVLASGFSFSFSFSYSSHD
jgi:hypothetical protein